MAVSNRSASSSASMSSEAISSPSGPREITKGDEDLAPRWASAGRGAGWSEGEAPAALGGTGFSPFWATGPAAFGAAGVSAFSAAGVSACRLAGAASSLVCAANRNRVRPGAAVWRSSPGGLFGGAASGSPAGARSMPGRPLGGIGPDRGAAGRLCPPGTRAGIMPLGPKDVPSEEFNSLISFSRIAGQIMRRF